MKKAEKNFEMALYLDKNDQKNYNNMGLLYKSLGEKEKEEGREYKPLCEKSLAYFNKAIELEKLDEEVRKKYIRLRDKVQNLLKDSKLDDDDFEIV